MAKWRNGVARNNSVRHQKSLKIACETAQLIIKIISIYRNKLLFTIKHYFGIIMYDFECEITE